MLDSFAMLMTFECNTAQNGTPKHMKGNRSIKYIFCLLGVFLACGISFAEPLPSSFDLRDINGHSYIGPVRDQGNWGSCYSFGALAAAESVYNRYHDLYDTAAIDLSEAFIMWSLDPLYEGFQGGWGSDYDLEELAGLVEHGVPLEADFPYVITDPGPDNHHWDAPRIRFAEWYRMPPNDIETTKRIIQRFGAVDVAVLVDSDFSSYSGGIFQNTDTSVNDILPYYSSTNHLVSLVGWEDDPGDGGMGYWILRNSWGADWAEDGYMRIRYTSAKVSMEGAYILYEPWSGEDVHWENAREVEAIPWSSGGTTNAHAVDIWAGVGSSVTNTGTLSATAAADADLATARGVYLWGGPRGSVTNHSRIHSEASSLRNQAIAYGICAQAHEVRNTGQIFANASATRDQALAFGVLLFNGGSEAVLNNSGTISANAQGRKSYAYGAWTDSRTLSRVINNGRIMAESTDKAAIGVLLSGGPASVTNTGRIEAATSAGRAIGIAAFADTTITNSGSIMASGPVPYSINSDSSHNIRLILLTGSELSGTIYLEGDNDYLELQGTGIEDEEFRDVETLKMNGVDWALTGSSSFDSIAILRGRLRVSGLTTVEDPGTLSGSGTLTGNVLNQGMVSPGNSIGTFSIGGDYVQGATGRLSIEIAGVDNYDKLMITGSAAIDGTLQMNVLGSYIPARGDRFTVLEAADVSGAFDGLSNLTPTLILNPIYDNTRAIMEVERDYQNPDLLSRLTANETAVATAISSVTGSATGDFDMVLAGIDAITDYGQAARAFDELSVKGVEAGVQTAITTASAQVSSLALRLNSVRSGLETASLKDSPSYGVLLASASSDLSRLGIYSAPINKDTGLFFTASTIFGEQDSSINQSGYDFTSTSLTFGLDRRFSDNLALGIFGGVNQTDTDINDAGSKSDVTGGTLGLYGTRQWGEFYMDGAISYGLSRHENTRRIVLPGIDRKAISDPDGGLFSMYAGIGRDFEVSGWNITPYAAIRYIRAEIDGYTETGAGSLNLSVDSHETDFIQPGIGARVSKTYSSPLGELTPFLTASYRHRYGEDEGSVGARLADVQTPGFSVATDSPDNAFGTAGAGLTLNFKNNASLKLEYNTVVGDDNYKEHQVMLGFRYEF